MLTKMHPEISDQFFNHDDARDAYAHAVKANGSKHETWCTMQVVARLMLERGALDDSYTADAYADDFMARV